MMPEISIIIPVYNAKLFLNRCIDSVLSQSFENFELLLIDDGSNDGSELICDGYVAIDSRISVFHKSNEGVSTARNVGIKHSRGKFVTFIDADDYVGYDFLDRLIVGREYDFVYGNSYIVGSNHPCVIEKEVKLVINDEASFNPNFKFIPLAKLSPWNKLYRRQIIEDYHLQFDESMYYGEDTLFVLQYLFYSQSICMRGIIPYYYDDSSSNKYKKISHSYLLNWLSQCINSYETIFVKWNSSYEKALVLDAVVSFQRNNYYRILMSLIKDDKINVCEKLCIIDNMRVALIPQRTAKFASKKERFVELSFSFGFAWITYSLFKIISYIKS